MGTKKIETLTEEQKNRMPEFRDKWVEIGLSTKRANRQAAEIAVKEAYKIAGLAEPKIFIWTDSPMGGLIGAKLLKEFLAKYPKDGVTSEDVRDSVVDSVRDSVVASVWDSVVASVRDSVRDSVRTSVWDSVLDSVVASVGDSVGDSVVASVRTSVRDSVRTSVWDSVGDSVWDSVVDSVGDSVVDSVRDSVVDSVRDSVRTSVVDSVRTSVRTSVLKQEWWDLGYYGQHEAGWLSFYDYFKEVVGLDVCKKLDPLSRLSQEVGWTWMYKGAVIFSERPTELHRNAVGKLHNDKGPAIKYVDGYELHRLNGIPVPKALAETPANELSAVEYLKEENVDIRREAFRKIGITKVATDLGAEVIDKMEDYELLLLDIGMDEKKPYLKMLNPSMGIHHIEGVEKGIKTCADALAWRNGLSKYTAPLALS